MTIGQAISNFRGFLLEYSRTPESFTDEFLYNILNAARVELLKQKLIRQYKISDENFHTLCVELEVTKATQCDCVPDEIACKVLRTKYKIPSVLTSRNIDKIQIYLLNGKSISLTNIRRWQHIKNVTSDYVASWINGYIYFWNLPLQIKYVEITGLFSDVVRLQDVPNCNPLTGTTTCYSMLDTPFPIDVEYELPMYQKAMQLMQIPATQILQDLTNDSNRAVKS